MRSRPTNRADRRGIPTSTASAGGDAPRRHREAGHPPARGLRLLGLLAALVLTLTACGSNTDGATSSGGGSSDSAPGEGSTAVGFIFVGPKDDFGYNQAAYEGAMALEDELPDLEVLTAENVPETDEAARVMEGMIAKGAKILFATSYGHLDAAMKVAADHPDVVVVQQGNVITGDVPDNAGTYFGTVYEPVFLAGIAAGLTTETNKLGYVYAFPIPQTIANINAFQLGAASVNPDAQTFVVNTSSWCDPGKQADAASSLFSQGVDVITQHQDCTSTITKAAEEEGVFVVGYHADASELAPNGWIAGSEWDWDALYPDIVATALAGDFTGSEYNANFRTGLKDGNNPFVESELGDAVPAEAVELIDAAREDISGDGSPFAGPVIAQDGSELVPAGTVPEYAEVEEIMTVFVQGVVGQIPEG